MKLFPTAEAQSVYQINFRRLHEIGIRGLIFDIDNTLVEHNAPADARAVKLFERIRGCELNTCLLSNNKEPRVKDFADTVGSLYLHKAGKPLAKGYLKAMELMRTEPETTLFIGDQLFTDIWGASNAGIRSVLVQRIAFHEEIQIHLKRIPEGAVLLFYRLLPRKRDIALEGALR